jgi:hypothetical protein
MDNKEKLYSFLIGKKVKVDIMCSSFGFDYPVINTLLDITDKEYVFKSEEIETKSNVWKFPIKDSDCSCDLSLMLYAFLYCPNVHESAWATMSLHYSKEGAEKAMEEHKQKELEEWNQLYDEDEVDFRFGENEDWRVEEVLIKP